MAGKTAAAIAGITLIFGSMTMIGSVRAGSEWRLEDRVEEVELTPDGEVIRVRYEGDSEFVPVENSVDRNAVKGLSFHERDLHLSVYLVEGSTLVGIKNKWVTRTVLKAVSGISGPVIVQLAHSVEDPMVIRYPDGQEATITQDGVTVNPPLPDLRTLWFHEGAATGLDFLGFRSFTLFEFFDPESKQIFTRNVVTEVPFQLADTSAMMRSTAAGAPRRRSISASSA